MKIKFLFLILIGIFSCTNDKVEKKAVLLADRKAPLGWIYLEIYKDKTFKFTSKGMRDDDVYLGNYHLKNDTIYFNYYDSIPEAGSKAVIKDGYVSYINGSYPESVQVKLNKLEEY